MSTTLSTIAQLLAAEIRAQDWSDAHTRSDGARHDRGYDRTKSETLNTEETERVLVNVMWVAGQALLEDDPNFDIRAFAQACGVPDSWLLNKRGDPNRGIEAGLRARRSRVVWDD